MDSYKSNIGFAILASGNFSYIGFAIFARRISLSYIGIEIDIGGNPYSGTRAPLSAGGASWRGGVCVDGYKGL